MCELGNAYLCVLHAIVVLLLLDTICSLNLWPVSMPGYQGIACDSLARRLSTKLTLVYSRLSTCTREAAETQIEAQLNKVSRLLCMFIGMHCKVLMALA